MSDNPEVEPDRTSVRVNVRIPRKQYDLMKRLGGTLGLETDGACVKYFVALGLQASAGGISAISSAESSQETLSEIKKMSAFMALLEGNK